MIMRFIGLFLAILLGAMSGSFVGVILFGMIFYAIIWMIEKTASFMTISNESAEHSLLKKRRALGYDS